MSEADVEVGDSLIVALLFEMDRPCGQAWVFAQSRVGALVGEQLESQGRAVGTIAAAGESAAGVAIDGKRKDG